MIRVNKYKITWEPRYGEPEPGFEYGHAPIITELTENSKILEKAKKFKFQWLQENMDKDWNNVRAVKDLLNDDVWGVFAEGLRGAEAIGAPTLELFAESWKQKGYKEIKYSCTESGYSLGTNGDWFGYGSTVENLDPLYVFQKLNEDDGSGEDNSCPAYWFAAISTNDPQSLVVSSSAHIGLFADWYSALSYGLRPVVCLPINAAATLKDGVWTNLTVQ